MVSRYKIIFLTNQPSFYKVRQWNELNKNVKIYVIFTEKQKHDRNADFVSEKPLFDYFILPSNNSIAKAWDLFMVLKTIKYERLIIGGWESLPAVVAPFLSKKSKNGVFVESSIYEYKQNLLKDFFKRIILSRFSIAYPSGKSQKKLIDKLGFISEYRYTGGCGLLNYHEQPPYEKREKVSNFLYVGRLVEEKNLKMLIEVFNELQNLNLSIIGFGKQEKELKRIAKENIIFIGPVANKDLFTYYQKADVFILPSKVEPWGLVIEEALNKGTPVIVSDKVGCKDDLVTNETGLIFSSDSKESLIDAIKEMTFLNRYNAFRLGISKLNFEERARKQVEAFIK